MKKMMTLALVALTALSAQALTIDWTGANTTTVNGSVSGSSLTGVTNTASLSNTTSWVAYAKITISNLRAVTETLVSPFLASVSASSTGRVFAYGGTISGSSTMTVAYSSGSSTTNMTLANGTYEILYFHDASTHTLTTIISDGTNVATFTATDTSSVTFTNLLVGVASSAATNSSLNTFADFTAETIVAEGVTLDYDSTTQSATILVPEPTCLALLALGVAGLALRRRA